ncbi:MAG: hypothetical protein LBK58_01905 [Prevotellaceae bacterium]|jgi:hypothetical protein|nr:hypothetical protein [Prevotellaceae bacterium]
MNKKVLGGIAIMIIAVMSVVNVNVNMKKNANASVSLTELEALAGEHMFDSSYKECFLLSGGFVLWLCYNGGNMYCYQGSPYEGECYY